MTLGLSMLAPLAAFVEAVLSSGGARVVLTLCGLAGAVPEVTLREEAGTRLLVWRRDPDARGHVRSRAPGRAVPAA